LSSHNNQTNYNNKVPKVNSSWIKKVSSGKNPSNNDLLEHLDIIHKNYAGFTEKVATSCRDSNGKNSYELLLNIVDKDKHKNSNVLDIACGSGVLLELLFTKSFTYQSQLTGVDISESELQLAHKKLSHLDINLYKDKAQNLHFIKNNSQDLIFCHWALTLMNPIIPVLKNIKRIIKSKGIFSAIVDGDSNSALGYSKVHDIIYKHTQKKYSKYGLIEIGDSRVRSASSLNQLIKEIFTDAEITISSHILSMKETPIILAEEVSKFFYASLVLSTEDRKKLISELKDFFYAESIEGLSVFNLPINQLVIKQN
jgi:ubiquinone/menaquinone biosynthesis C-methylase UbiE